jgi:hypothetical protein
MIKTKQGGIYAKKAGKKIWLWIYPGVIIAKPAIVKLPGLIQLLK